MELLAGADREALRKEAFSWVKNLGNVPVQGKPFRSQLGHRGISLWWWCETPLWSGMGGSHGAPAAAQVFLVAGAVERALDRWRPDRVVLAGDGGWGPLKVAGQVAQSQGIQVKRGWSPHTGSPISLRPWLLRTALRRRRAAWKRQRLTRGTLLFVSYSTRVRIAGGGEDSNISSLTREIDVRGASWRVITVDNAADASSPWRPSLGSVPKGYHPLEALIGTGPADAAGAAVAEFGQRMKSAWPDLARHLRRKDVDLAPVYFEAFRNLAKSHIPAGIYYYEAFREVMALRPRGVVVVNETGYAGRGAVAAANEAGVPSVGLQHGIIAPLHVEYIHPPGAKGVAEPDLCPIPSLTLLDGRYYEEVLTRYGGFPPERVRVVGAARYDAFLEEARRGPPPAADHVTVITQPLEEVAGWFPGVMATLSRSRGAKVAVRPHPLEDPAVYERMLREMGMSAPVYAKEPLVDILLRSRAVVAPPSTAVVEANLLGLPVALVNFSGEQDYVPYAERGGAVTVSRLEDLGAIIEDFLNEGPRFQALRTARPVFLEEFAHGAGQGCANRAAEAILRVCEEPGSGD